MTTEKETLDHDELARIGRLTNRLNVNATMFKDGRYSAEDLNRSNGLLLSDIFRSHKEAVNRKEAQLRRLRRQEFLQLAILAFMSAMAGIWFYTAFLSSKS